MEPDSPNLETFDFSEALVHLKNGLTVARTHWKNPGKYVYLDRGKSHGALDPHRGTVDRSPCLMWRDDKGRHSPWTPSHDALLAEDWFVGVSGDPELCEPSTSDSAWHSVWLHGKWDWLTKNMTTKERETAADAVQRYSNHLAAIDGRTPEELDGLRWWRDLIDGVVSRTRADR